LSNYEALLVKASINRLCTVSTNNVGGHMTNIELEERVSLSCNPARRRNPLSQWVRRVETLHEAALLPSERADVYGNLPSS
jgi:hypothetical protein